MAFERRIVTRFDATTAGFDRGTARVAAQLQRLERTADTRLQAIDRRFERAGRAVLNLATAVGALGVGLGVGAVRQYAESWRQAERSLTAAGFAIDGNREKLAQLAIRTRGDFDAVGGAVSRFARATGADLDTTIRRVETLKKLLALGGATTAEASSTTLQLSQALRAGRLQGDEFRALSENAPIELLDALARQLGATRNELKALSTEGVITTQVILAALDELATTADRSFAQLAVSGTEALKVLQTGFATFFGRVDEQIGITAGVNEVLADLGRFLSEDAEAAATFAKALEVAAVAAVSLASARAGGGVVAMLRESVERSREAAVASRSLVATTQAEVAANIRKVQVARDAAIAAREQAAAARAQASALAQSTATDVQKAQARRALAAADAAVIRTNAQLTAATNALSASEGRAAAATNALTIAQGRLSVATRVTAAAMGTLRSVVAFFGGIPGLVFAAASAMIIFSDSIFGASDATERAADAISTAEDTAQRLRSTQQALVSDTDALRAANERLTSAIDAQQGAAADMARVEIDAINRRIAKNAELKEQYEDLLRAQLAIAEAAATAARRDFNRTEGRLRATEVQQIVGNRPIFDPTAQADLEAAAREAVERRRSAIVAAQDAGQTLSDSDVEFLKQSAALAKLEAEAEALRDALDKLGEPVTVKIETSGAVSSARQTIDAMEDLEKRIADIEAQARRLTLGEVTAELAELELAFRAQGFSAIETIEPVNRLREALLSLAGAGNEVKQEAAFDEIAAEIRAMTAEAVAVRDGEEAFRDFRAEGERSEFLDQYRRKLVEAGVEGDALERTINALAAAFDNLRGAVASVGFQTVLNGVRRQIDDIQLETTALQKAIAAGNEEIFDSFRSGRAIDEIISARERELASEGFGEAEIVFQTAPLRDALQELDSARDAFQRTFSSRGGGGGGRSAAREEISDLERILDAGDARAAQIRDEIELLGARNSAERAYLEERQRLLADAADAGITLDPNFVEAQARAIGELTAEFDALRFSRHALDDGADFIARQQLEAEALLLTEEAARRLRFEFDLLNDAQRAGIELTPLQAAELRALAAEMAAAETATAELEERIDFARDATGGFFSDLISGLRNGESAWKTFGDAANRVLDRVIDKLLNEFLDAIFTVNNAAAGGGSKKGGGLFGAIGSIFSGIVGTFSSSGFGFGNSLSTSPLATGANIPIIRLHSGGVVGETAAPRSWVPPFIFDHAPRMHGGGVAGLLPNEVPAILERGEIVVPNGASFNRGNTVIDASMVINIDRPGASMEEIERRLEPRLAAHREETITRIRKSNNLNPRFLEG